MRKKYTRVVLLVLSFFLLSKENLIFITEQMKIDFLKKLMKNNLFFNYCFSIDHDKKSFYFLDSKFRKVFRVDRRTGKLLNTISSPGQGPAELQKMTPREN